MVDHKYFAHYPTLAKQMVDHRMTLFPRSSLIRGIGFPVEIYRLTFVA